MKKIIILFVAFMLVVCIGLFLPQNGEKYDYLRLHIRANSNLEIDQKMKYDIKSMLVDFLTPYLCDVSSKEEAVNKITGMTYLLEAKCDEMLKEKGFSYLSNIKINNEYFPTRTYDNTTLESGYYDAVIVELGEAEGDNWWCVMYPPLCFVNKNNSNSQIKYKSKIVEWFNSVFK